MSDAPQKEISEKEKLIEHMNAVLVGVDKALGWAKAERKAIVEGRLLEARKVVLEGLNVAILAYDALEPRHADVAKEAAAPLHEV